MPSSSPSTQIGIRIDNEAVAQLDAMCEADNRSRANLIETLIRRAYAVAHPAATPKQKRK